VVYTLIDYTAGVDIRHNQSMYTPLLRYNYYTAGVDVRHNQSMYTPLLRYNYYTAISYIIAVVCVLIDCV
jgi:hypothetical protein